MQRLAWTMTLLLVGCTSSTPQPENPQPTGEATGSAAFKTLAETFADVNVLRYRVPGFEQLSQRDKLLAYYLYEAALAGYDIHYDQNYRYNLAVRRTLEAILRTPEIDPTTRDSKALLAYAKRVWFSHGIHHHYSGKKFVPELSPEAFAALVRQANPQFLPLEDGQGGRRDLDAFLTWITPIIFDPAKDPVNVSHQEGADLVQASANNFYEGVNQREVEAYYAGISKADPARPLSLGLNSKLMRVDGKLQERVWKVDGMYGAAIAPIVTWLEKAVTVAENPEQRAALEQLVRYYRSGDLHDFDVYNQKWVADTASRLDVISGFIETYGDALGYRGTFEAVVSFKDMERSKRIAAIGAAAQYFEDQSPILPAHKKQNVVGISAKVITVVVESGDAAPVTPVGINLPNSQWIRKDYGSKSVFLGNIVDAHDELEKESGVLAVFAASAQERQRAERYAGPSYALKVDMHEVIGHASGQLEPGVGPPNELLKAYAAPLEEARADLVALYYLMDPKLTELGLVDSPELAKAGYDAYVRGALLVMLARIEPGEALVQTHMRSRHMIASWAMHQGAAKKVIERVEHDGEIFYVINDYQELRRLWGELLREVQRIKSQGDYAAGKALIETYGVTLEPAVHQSVLRRYAKLPIEPYSGFIQPKLTPVFQGDSLVDVTVSYPDDFATQMLEYAASYSHLPTFN